MKEVYLPILMYHKIFNKEVRERYAVSVKNFEEQMEYLSQNGFKSIIPEDISGLTEKNDIKWIMITFDDGYETDYTIALPILRKYGFKCVSFVTTNFVGKDGYLSWEQINKLKEEGFSIQSHSHTHRLLNSIDEKELRKELYISKQLIESSLNMKVNSLALPGGRYGRNIKKISEELGYEYIFSSRPGINIINNSLLNFFCRMLISNNTSLERFKNIVNFDKKTYQQSRLSHRIKCIIKQGVGQRIYHQLWSRYIK